MPYSAVTQPRPELRIHGGTRSSTEAVHSTCVSPNRTRHEPSAWREKPGSSEILRSWSGARPDGRITTLLTTVRGSKGRTGTGAYGQVGRNRQGGRRPPTAGVSRRAGPSSRGGDRLP